MSYTRQKVYAALPQTTRGQPVHLGGDPKGKNVLYANGRSVFIRDLANPYVADQYTEHTSNVTVARYAPSGYYIASGDVSGNVRIWDTTQAEHPLKLEIKVIAGEIKDLAWDSESKRIIAVGNGQERFGHAFLFDSGSSVGEISGHSKTVNSVDIKSTRPYRAVTVSDDLSVNYFEGPPFKYKFSNKDHSRFVNCIRFSPNGEHFATVGSDSKIILFDGKTGEKIAELGGEGAHTGSIFSCSWSPDSKSLMTCSGDRTVKVWDIAAQKAATTFTFGKAVEDQQVGCLWQGEYQVSLSLSGDFNYLDPNSPEKPRQVITGHNKPISSLAIKDKTIFTGDISGRIASWNVDQGIASLANGVTHTNQVLGFSLKDDTVVSAGLDDTVRETSASTKAISGDVYKAESQPKAVASTSHNDLTVVALADQLVVLQANKKSSSLAVKYQPLSLAFSIDGTELAVGTTDAIHLYTFSNTTLIFKKELTGVSRGQVSALAYSPDGLFLAAGDSSRQLILYDTATHADRGTDWCFHQNKIVSIAWAPSSKNVATGSLDTHIFVWSLANPNKRIQIKNAHVGQVNAIAFNGENEIVSVGQDASVKVWGVTHN